MKSWYKRYGYTFSSDSSANAEPSILVATFISVLIAIISTLYFDSPWPLLVVIVLYIYWVWKITQKYKNIRHTIRKKRRALHTKNALKHYELGNYIETKESIRRAGIYGELSSELKIIQDKFGDSNA